MNRICWLTSIVLLAPIAPLHACHLNIYANQNMKPKVYLQDGVPTGILIDMMDYIGNDIGCEFTYQLSSWPRAYKKMLATKGAVIGLAKTDKREQYIDYSDAMYFENILLITHIDNPFSYHKIEDLAGKTVGATRLEKMGNRFSKGVENNIFTFVPDNGNLRNRLKRVAKKRLDVAVISPGLYALNNIFKDHPKLARIRDKLYIVPTAFNIRPNFLGFAKKYRHNNKHQEFLKKFNFSMSKAIKSGIFQAIENKHHHLN